MCRSQFFWRDPQRVGSDFLAIKLVCVFEHCRESRRTDFATNPRDCLRRRQRFAKHFECFPTPGFTHDVPINRELVPEGDKFSGSPWLAGIDASDINWHCFSAEEVEIGSIAHWGKTHHNYRRTTHCFVEIEKMKGVLPPRIDLLSDTLTRPTPEMRAAMATAEVGDDVFGEDPTVRRLEEHLAGMLGKEAALFMPSGTMSNLIGLLVHCGKGDEFICEAGCHIFNNEQAGYAQVGGIAVQPILGERGILRVDQLQDKIRGDNDHLARTRLICLEQTHNRAAGSVLPYEAVAEICAWGHEQGLACHLDGARLFNAVVAAGISATDWAQHFDTVSVCFSKGLGAPVGSALCGTAAKIKLARRVRKLLGGGMRQIGILAAAALYALEHHVDRLAEDHAKARVLADAVRRTSGLTLQCDPVETNIVIFEVAAELGTAVEFCASLHERGVRLYPIGRQKIRMVTHLDVSMAECEEVAEMLG